MKVKAPVVKQLYRLNVEPRVVDQLTKLTKGVAFYTSSGELASCVMESYLSGRKKKTYIA